MADPGQFARFIRNNKASPNVIIGYEKDGSSAVQAYRYPVREWTEAKARAHCKEKGGRFEPAMDRAIRKAAGRG